MSDTERQRELIENAVAGDRAALERLMIDHYTPLAQWIRRIPWGRPTEMVDVDDVVQQTFTQVFQYIDRYQQREGITFFAWLTTIAENQMRDAIRAQRRKKRGGDRRRLHRKAGSDCDWAGDLIDVVTGNEHTPSKSLGRREAIQAIQIAIAGLNEEYRRAVQLRYFEGRSLEETANLMGRTTGAVRGLLDRSKKKIRAAMGRASLYLSKK